MSEEERGPEQEGPQQEQPEAKGPQPERPQPEGAAPEGGEATSPRAVAMAATGRQRLTQALWPPRVSRAQLVVAVLLFALGLGLALQVRSTNESSQLRGARQEDLVRILDEVDARQQRLQQEKQQLQQSLTQLQNSRNQAAEAQRQTKQKEEQLGILAGTVAATGPGIELTIRDPGGNVQADMLLNTLQELRAAGAEAVQINNVRVVVSTWFSDAGKGSVEIDGTKVSQPYLFTVIGNAQDLDTALNIPGGVVQSVERDKGTATVVERKQVSVTALITPKSPDYAHTAQP
ncbi:DUF881 domain-containing protein [Streptacidiphilus monticola]|uniref:DUF881 domain-containing protein n=1 Tax=Streptacidiphilus monticola TaxID=2161674 RepID=A0ABW1G0E7_9ACTN